MKKNCFTLFAMLWCMMCNATNYYVDAVFGSNSNTGKSSDQAFRTIQTAANLTNAGDTVFIMNGTYTSAGTVLNISRSGSDIARIVYTNFPGHSPKLQASGTSFAVVSFSPGTSYININGLEISGNGVNLSLANDTIPAKNQLTCPTVGSPATAQNPVQKYNGHGITADSRSVTIGTHHVLISNNKVHDNAAAGIGFLRCDYITIENNIVYNNSWYTIYGTSGISFNQSYNYDNNTTTYRNIVRNNISYGNRMYVPFYNDCKVTDGNGIILDIPLVEYVGKSLVANNICFNNGGSGIHSFKMNHVDIVHNVSYLNSASPEINSSNIYALQADDIKIYNNIIVARPGKKMNGVNNSTNLFYDYNIFYGGSSHELVGEHSIMQDPKFVNPSIDPLVANFRLQPGSLGVNRGDNSNSYGFDILGDPRPFASAVDIGAYESNYSGGAYCAGINNSLVISNGNGNGTGEASANLLYSPAETRPSVSNQKSRRAFIYPAALLTTIPANTSITSLKFRRAFQTSPANTTPSTQDLPSNCSFRVYLRNEASDHFGSAPFDWNTIQPEAASPAILVYGGDAASIVGNAGGWKEIVFQVPFTYTGSNLGVFVEYIQNGNVAGATDINWIYDNGGTQTLYNISANPNAVNGFKATSTNGTNSLSNNLSTSNERRPVATFSYCASGLLPVTLTGFNAFLQNKKVFVSWYVTSEINNDGFEVQRSTDGFQFEPIGFVYAKPGNASVINQYNFTDVNPVSGNSFYRIVQKEKDGKLTYSRIVTVTLINKTAISIYPNPVIDKLNVRLFETSQNTSATIQISDNSGRIMSSYKKALIPGYNNLEINISDLAAATYFVQVVLSSGERIVDKFTKL